MKCCPRHIYLIESRNTVVGFLWCWCL